MVPAEEPNLAERERVGENGVKTETTIFNPDLSGRLLHLTWRKQVKLFFSIFAVLPEKSLLMLPRIVNVPLAAYWQVRRKQNLVVTQQREG